MGQEWYYLQNGQQHGPVSAAELHHLALTGKLQLGHMIWKQGMSQWVLAGSVPGVFPQPSAPSATPDGGVATKKTSLPEDDEVEEVEGVAPKKTRLPRMLAGKVMNWFVWLGVTIWCLLPFFWLILTAITNRPTTPAPSSPYNSPSYNASGSTSLGTMVGFGGAGFLLLALFYGIWCTVGVVCGFGVERALTVTGELAAHFKSKQR
jgi:hypothetical protein